MEQKGGCGKMADLKWESALLLFGSNGIVANASAWTAKRTGILGQGERFPSRLGLGADQRRRGLLLLLFFHRSAAGADGCGLRLSGAAIRSPVLWTLPGGEAAVSTSSRRGADAWRRGICRAGGQPQSGALEQETGASIWMRPWCCGLYLTAVCECGSDASPFAPCRTPAMKRSSWSIHRGPSTPNRRKATSIVRIAIPPLPFLQDSTPAVYEVFVFERRR